MLHLLLWLVCRDYMTSMILKIFKFLMYLDQEQKCTSNNLNLVQQFPRCPGQVSKSCYCINYQDLAQAALLLNIGFKLHL